jgi:hypothetical protein
VMTMFVNDSERNWREDCAHRFVDPYTKTAP